MSDLTNNIQSLRATEDFSKLNSDDQRKEQYRYIIENLNTTSQQFREAPYEVKKLASKKILDQTYSPVFENPEMQAMSDRLIGEYQAGSPEARQAMGNYYQGSRFNEKLGVATRGLTGLLPEKFMNDFYNVPGQYAAEGFSVNRTRGADDNKLRSNIEQAFRTANDQGMIDVIDSKLARNLGIASHIIEGIGLGLVSAATATVLAGSIVAPTVGTGVKEAFKFMVSKNLPAVATEAALEGALGVAEYVADRAQEGTKSSIAGSAGAFGMYAGLDVAFNLLVGTVAPTAKYVALPFIKKLKNSKVTKAIETLTASGIGDEALPAAERAHGIAHRRYQEITASFKNPDDLEALSEFDRLLYDGFESSFDVTKNTNDMIEVRAWVDPDSTKLFDNPFEARDYMATASIKFDPELDIKLKTSSDTLTRPRNKQATTRPLEDIINRKIEGGQVEDIISYRERHASLVKSLMGRNNIDSSLTVPSPNAKFIPTSKRQVMAPSEFEALLPHLEETGYVVRFNTDVNKKILKATRKNNIFAATDDIQLRPEDIDPNGNVLYFVGSKANADDWTKALEEGRQAAAREGGFTPEQFARDRLIANNYQGAVTPDGTEIVFFPERLKIITNRVDPKTGKLGNLVSRPKASATIASSKKAFNYKAQSVVDSPEQMARLAKSLMDGDLEPTSIQSLAKLMALKNGVTDFDPRLVSVGDTFKLVQGTDGLILRVPKNITGDLNQRAAYKKLLDEVNALTKGNLTGGTLDVDAYMKAFNNTKPAPIMEGVSNKTKLAWVENLKKTKAKPKTPAELSTGYKRHNRQAMLKDPTQADLVKNNPNVKVNTAGKAFHYFDGMQLDANTIDEAIFEAGINNIDSELLNHYFKSRNIPLEANTNGKFIHIKDLDKAGFGLGTEEIAARSNLRKLLADKGVEFKLPSSLAPKEVIITRTPELNVEFQSTAAMGDQTKLSNFIGQFEDYHKAAIEDLKILKPDGSTLSKIKKDLFEVNLKSINYRKQFATAAEARSFLEKDWKNLANLEEAAADKGFRLTLKDGHYELRNSNTKLIANTEEELYNQLGKVKTPTYGNTFVPADVQAELDKLGISARLPNGWSLNSFDSVDDIPQIGDTLLKPNKAEQIHKRLGRITDFLTPKRAAIQANLKRLGNKELSDSFIDLDVTARRAHNLNQVEVGKAVKLFTVDGKVLPMERRKLITQYLEAGTEKVRNNLVSFHNMTPAETNVGDRLAELYSELGDRLSIPILERFKNYQPHLRAWANRINGVDVVDGVTADFLASPAGTKAFQSLEMRQFFARFDRTEDLIKTGRNYDALDLYLQYSKNGHNEAYMKNSWSKINSLLKSVPEVKDSNLIPLLESFREGVTHVTTTVMDKDIKRTAANIVAKFGLPPEDGKRWFDLMLNASYQVNMSWRPWQPFRNVWQVYNVLPIKTGSINVTNRAIRKMIKDPDKYKAEMIARGVFTDDAAQAQQIKALLQHQYPKGIQWVFDFGQKGLGWFTSSDHNTRIIAGLAADELFDKGLKKATVGGQPFSEGVFLKKSRLETFDEPVQAAILKRVKEGNIEGARNLYAMEMVNETMFDYSKANKPIQSKGILGKMYYQYMTYPMNLASTMKRTMQNGSLSGKVKGAIAYGAGMSGIAAGMGALGVNNSNFLLWNQVGMSGGPLWTDLYNLTQLNQQGPTGSTARKEYLRKIGITKKDGEYAAMYPTTLPGNIQARYFMKAVDAAEHGDYWRAFLYLTTTPVDKEWEKARGVYR